MPFHDDKPLTLLSYCLVLLYCDTICRNTHKITLLRTLLLYTILLYFALALKTACSYPRPPWSSSVHPAIAIHSHPTTATVHNKYTSHDYCMFLRQADAAPPPPSSARPLQPSSNNTKAAHPHAGSYTRLHLVQQFHGGVDRDRDRRVVQQRTRSPLVADDLLRQEVVREEGSLSIPSTEYLFFFIVVGW